MIAEKHFASRLPLRLPQDVSEAAAAAVEEEQSGLEMPERGPEITETR